MLICWPCLVVRPAFMMNLPENPNGPQSIASRGERTHTPEPLRSPFQLRDQRVHLRDRQAAGRPAVFVDERGRHLGFALVLTEEIAHTVPHSFEIAAKFHEVRS